MYRSRSNFIDSEKSAVRHSNYTEEDMLPQTQQHFKDRCDIRNIIQSRQPERLTGYRGRPVYGDYRATSDGTVPTLADLENARLRRDRIWRAMPASVRARFRAPEEFLLYCEDPAHTDEIRAMYGISPVSDPAAGGGVPIATLDAMGLTDTKQAVSVKIPDTAKPKKETKNEDTSA